MPCLGRNESDKTQLTDYPMNYYLLIIGLLTSSLAMSQATAPVLAPMSTTVTTVTSSTTPTKPKPERSELKYDLNESGSHYLKLTLLNQAWVRFNDSNPGTTVIGDPANNTFDIGLRRTRMQLYGQINDRMFIYVQFGMNNFNFLNGLNSNYNIATSSTANPDNAYPNRIVQAYFHDAVGEYTVFKGKDYLKIGGGLTIVNGLSRFSQPSVSSIMSLDVPVFAQATVNQTDEFSRKLSLYVRGQVGHLDYRLALSDPFPIQTNGAAPPALGPNANFALKGHHKQFQGFFIYNFFDKETQITPGYMTGTYLGKKKVVNLEAGFITQRNATWRTGTSATDTVYQNLNLWSVATFVDMPLNTAKGTAINFYAGYFHTDYGQNYLRYNGIMNPASGLTGQATSTVGGNPAGSTGNAYPTFGTGSVMYAQFGYLMKQDLMGHGNGTLMPYVQAQIANYQRIDATMGVYNIGLNYLIRNHNTKLTLDYQNRPVFTVPNANGVLTNDGRCGSITLQYQVFI